MKLQNNLIGRNAAFNEGILKQGTLDYFVWKVPEGGWELIVGTDVSKKPAPKPFYTKFLVPSDGPSHQSTHYSPSKLPVSLFLEFAKLKGDDDSFLGFATLRGGLKGAYRGVHPRPKSLTKDRLWFGQHLSEWKEAWRAFSDGVFLWESLRSESVKALGRHFRFESNGEYFFIYDPLNKSPAMGSASPIPEEISLKQRQSWMRSLAMKSLSELLSYHLQKACDLTVRTNGDDATFQIAIEPCDLECFMWIEFAKAVASSSEFRQCPECPNWFEITRRHYRTDKNYCSDACRQRAYRLRKAS